jgi:hypothetical protein
MIKGLMQLQKPYSINDVRLILKTVYIELKKRLKESEKKSLQKRLQKKAKN